MDKPVRMDSRHAFRKSREERPVHPCTRDFVFSLATCGSLFVLGSWSLTAVGCAAGTKTNEQRISQRRNLNPVSQQQIAAKEAAKNAAQGAKNTNGTTGQPVATLTAETKIEGALVGTVNDDWTTLADMSSVHNGVNTTTAAGLSEATITPGRAAATTMLTASTAPRKKAYLPNGTSAMMAALVSPTVNQPTTTPSSKGTGDMWSGVPNAFAHNNTSAVNQNPGWPGTGRPPSARLVSTGSPYGNGPAPTNAATNGGWNGTNGTNGAAANSALTINTGNTGNWNGKGTGTGTNDAMELSRQLANAFAKAGEGSMDPLRVWFIYSSLAVSNPEITLPDGWDTDLLPTERDRVTAAHAGFVALGRSFRDGANTVDSATRQALVAALTGEPQLTIPKVDLCTKVTGYGDYSPLQRRSFLAGAANRVIVYSELDGFRSQLENGKWTTRLATRVSIVPANSNTATNSKFIAWSRTPEWTEVVDTSDSPRCEFFLGEIIPIANNLSAGNYNVRVEVKDLATGAITSQVLPIEVLDERAFAAVND
jgi:hypothetical protein